MKITESVVFIFSVLFFSYSLSFSFVGTGKSEKLSLKGLEGVYVYVSIDNRYKEFGLSEAQCRNDIEAKLRVAGIKVLTKYESDFTVGAPWLWLHINGQYKDGKELHVAELALNQEVYIPRNMFVMNVDTWSVEHIGCLQKKETVRNAIKDMTDSFINDYLSVN